jgi:isopentenyl diphosphate isomerase/L-lactate dehydrogenase-like FMN-dependent dehydrogenase
MDRRQFVSRSAAVLALQPAVAAAATASPPIPSAVGPLKIASLLDLEDQARRVLGEGAFTFAADGSGAEWTLHENRRAFDRYVINPDYLAGRAAPDLRTTILGHALSLPVFTCPMGSLGLIHATADVGMAQGTSASGALMTMSTRASRTIEQVAAAATGPKWYQLYMPRDRGQARAALQRARAAGFSAVVFTIDALGPGSSEALARTGYDLEVHIPHLADPAPPSKYELGWDDLVFVLKEAGLPVILKGVLTPVLARRAAEAGVAAVQVSNHGGRQTDGLPAALDALPPVVEAVDGRVPVLMDSGIRRGVDVFKALALGAKAVGLGRPALYGLALGGPAGVQSVYDRLKLELALTMQGAGVDRVDQINSQYVRRAT